MFGSMYSMLLSGDHEAQPETSEILYVVLDDDNDNDNTNLRLANIFSTNKMDDPSCSDF